jgi:thiamine biosynthesis lipoprotein ApbE
MGRAKKIFLYLLFFIFLSGCSRPLLFKETRILMDTLAEISCFSSDKAIALKAMKEAFKEMERIEKFFSRYNETSEFSKINSLAGTEEMVIGSELFKIIERSIYYSRLSEGSFDITVAPLVDIWSRAKKDYSMPDAEVIEAALEHVGYKNIIMDEKRLSIRFSDKDTKIDMGGIVKGYAVDMAREILLSYDIENALVNIGGNIFAMGSPPGKKDWQIGIRDPRDKDNIVYRLNLKDMAVSTSGDYERFFVLNGRRFSHIIDPKAGRPAEGIMSVTIVSDSAEASDALSTSVFVMGIEKGLRLIKSLEQAAVFIFDKDGDLVKYP